MALSDQDKDSIKLTLMEGLKEAFKEIEIMVDNKIKSHSGGCKYGKTLVWASGFLAAISMVIGYLLKG